MYIFHLRERQNYAFFFSSVWKFLKNLTGPLKHLIISFPRIVVTVNIYFIMIRCSELIECARNLLITLLVSIYTLRKCPQRWLSLAFLFFLVPWFFFSQKLIAYPRFEPYSMDKPAGGTEIVWIKWIVWIASKPFA